MREPKKSMQPENGSDAEIEGLVASKSAGTPFENAHLRWWSIFAVTIAALMLFVASDYRRSISDTKDRLHLGVQYLSAELADSDKTSATALLGFLIGQMPAGARVFLVDSDDNIIAATGEVFVNTTKISNETTLGNSIWKQADISGDLGKAVLAIDLYTALRAFFERSIIGAGIALALLLLSWRHTILPTRPSQAIGGDLSRMIDMLPFGVAYWSQKGKLVACNGHYRTRLGLSVEDTKPGSAYVNTMNKVKAENGYQLVSDEALIRLSEIRHDDDSCILIDERPLHDGGFITLVTDNSEQVIAKRELEKLQKEQRGMAQQLREEKIKAEAASRSKTSFLAHLSHDVRTPLNHIIGFADLIAHETYGKVGDKRYLNYINDIKSSGEKLLTSFTEILELAQLEGGNLVLRRETIEVAEVLKAIAARYRENAERAGLALDVTIPDETLLFADRICVERMLGNIIENAIRFTPKGGMIKLVAWLGQDGIVLEISDTGIGMSPERLEDLSHPFVLGDAAFTREGGVGLGIAISRAIAELSGGGLAIDSSPAVGTTVAISLPLQIAKKAKVSRAA